MSNTNVIFFGYDRQLANKLIKIIVNYFTKQEKIHFSETTIKLLPDEDDIEDRVVYESEEPSALKLIDITNEKPETKHKIFEHCKNSKENNIFICVFSSKYLLEEQDEIFLNKIYSLFEEVSLNKFFCIIDRSKLNDDEEDKEELKASADYVGHKLEFLFKNKQNLFDELKYQTRVFFVDLKSEEEHSLSEELKESSFLTFCTELKSCWVKENREEDKDKQEATEAERKLELEAETQRQLQQQKQKEQEEYENKLRRYEQDFLKAVQAEYPLSEMVRNGTRNFSESLELKAEDVERIEQPILAEAEVKYQQKLQAAEAELKSSWEKENPEEEAKNIKQTKQTKQIKEVIMTNDQGYELFFKKREVLEKIIRQQLAFLNALDMKGWVDTINKLQQRVESDNFKVLVVGEFKRGKSTFINALLGEEILPSYAKPCTAIINEIKWGETRRAMLHFNSDENENNKPPQEIPIDEVEKYVVIKDGVDQKQAIHDTPYEKVEIFWDLDLCKNGVEIIDSPGLNENEIRQKVTMDYLFNVDAILFVLTCEALASQSEIDVINNTLRKSGHEDIFFICNRFDSIRKKEQDDLKQYGIAKLGPLTKRGEKRVFFISALKALEGRLDEDQDQVENSGILPLEKDLQEFLIYDRGRIKLLRPAMELRISIQEARRIIPERRSLLQTDVKTVEQRYADAQKPLQQLETQRQQIRSRINNFLEDIKLAVRGEAQAFYMQLADEKINEWIENYEIKEPIEFFKFEFLTKQIERVVTEITEFFQTQIESELSNWQSEQLEPMIKQRLESLMLELDQKASNFIKDVDNLRLQIAPGSFKASVDPEKRVSALERIFAAAGGFFLTGSVGSAAMGAVFGYEEMLKSIIPQIGLVIGALLLGFTSPWVLIPVLMGGGMVQGFFKMKSTNNKVKQTVAKEYIKQIRHSNYEQSCQIADSVVKKLQEIQKKIDQGLEKEIQSIRDQVNSILTEKQKGQTNVEEKLHQLQLIEGNMNKMDGELDEFITQVTLG